jgi:23S rRNA pseudouridine2605 synthase
VAEERLQKIIAAAGVTSRRKAEELITQGRVTVNGQVITELGSKADPERDHIKVDGKLLRGAERHIYLLLNKPKGYVTTVADPEGRPTVMDLVKHVGERIYPVGRLDYGSEGLLLMTNDGELANFLTRAASHVPKTYLVKISGQASEEDIDKLRHGLRIGSKPGARGTQAVRTAPAQVRIVREAENPWYEVTLIEGKNRQIRRMFEEIGHHVEKIKRVRYGPLNLDVEPGQFRELTQQELLALRKPAPKTHPVAIKKSAAKAAGRFIGKAGIKRREQQRFHKDRGQERFRPREERPRTPEQQGEAGRPQFGRRAEPEERKFGRRGERPRKPSAGKVERERASKQENRNERYRHFERDSRGWPARPQFGPRAEQEARKSGGRGERTAKPFAQRFERERASGKEHGDERRSRFERDSRGRRGFDRSKGRSEGRSPKSRFKPR